MVAAVVVKVVVWLLEAGRDVGNLLGFVDGAVVVGNLVEINVGDAAGGCVMVAAVVVKVVVKVVVGRHTPHVALHTSLNKSKWQ